ncbi:MAG: NeuD/PglB/VioB family sugar acetyltransferase [Alphaproteobacteria bacterium]
MQSKYVIVGCGGHSKSVADVILFNKPDADIIFIDDNAKQGEKIFSFPVVSDYKINDEKVVLGIGDNNLRRIMYEKFQSNLDTIISNDVYQGKNSNVGLGTFIAHNAHIGPLVRIGNGCIINTHCVLDHEVIIGDFSHISVNATLCGKVKIGSNVFVGAGAVIKDGVNVCDDVVIGAGAVVVKDINEKGVYVGCPARKVKELK